MPRAPRGKRVVDAASGDYMVMGRAANGDPDPYFDKSRSVWVAPWHKPDGKMGRPTGRTRMLAEASRDRHVALAAEQGRCGPLAPGFTKLSTISELSLWWLDNVARHRVRVTTLSTYSKQIRLMNLSLGDVVVRELRPERVAMFLSKLIDAGSAARAVNVRTLLVQVLDEAVNLGLAEENVAKKVRRPKVPKVKRRTLSPAEVTTLLGKCDKRVVAAVALCYVQGWRVSEALGLAWEDIDFENGAVQLRRAATYADGIGMILGAPKTVRTGGRQLLGPTVLDLLARRREQQLLEFAEVGIDPVELKYEGELIHPVFTTPMGKLRLRQYVDKAIRSAATDAKIDSTALGTHTGRRSVVTNLYASGDFDLEDVARFVGHADVSTTRGYIQHEGERPVLVSQKALELLDPAVGRVATAPKVA